MQTEKKESLIKPFYFWRSLILLMIFVLFAGSGLVAQNGAKKEKEIYEKLGEMDKFVETKPDSVIALSRALLQKSIDLNYEEGITYSLNNLGYGYFWKQEYDSAVQYYLKAFSRAKQNPKSFLYALTLSNYADIVDKRGKKDSALIYHHRALKVFEEIKDTHNIGLQLSSLGLIQWRQGRNIEALTYFFDALEYRRKSGDPKAIGMTLNNIGVIYWRLGNYEKALEAYIESLELRESIGNFKGIVVVSNNIGLVFLKLNNFEKSYEKFSTGLKLSKEHQYNFGIGYSSYNLADWHLKKGNYEKAIPYAKAAIENYYRYLELNSVAMALNYLGLAYKGLKQYSLAEKTFKAALDTATKVNDNHSITVTTQNIARLLIDQNKGADAITFLKQAEKRALKEKVGDLLLDNHQIMSDAYSSLGDYKGALLFTEKYMHMKDSLVFTELGTRITSWQIKYETRLQEQENLKLKFEAEVKANELKQLKNQQNLLITLIIASLGLSIGLIAFGYYKRKISRHIFKQKEELERTNALLAEANETKKKLLSIIAHDLTSPFQGLFGHLEIAKEDLHEMSREEIKLQLERISEAAKNLFSVAVGLLQWSQTQDQRIHINKEVINVKEIITSVMNVLSIQSEKKEIKVGVEINDKVDIITDKQLLTTILMNLCSNAIKFTPRSGLITIKSFSRDGEFFIAISDNGVGIDPDKINDLFILSKKKTSIGTDNEKGTGFGLFISKEFASLIGGNLLVESKLSEGSTFTLVIPQ